MSHFLGHEIVSFRLDMMRHHAENNRETLIDRKRRFGCLTMLDSRTSPADRDQTPRNMQVR